MRKLKKLPQRIYVAVSGGVDSVVLLHFLKRHHDVTVVHYIHDSDYSETEFEFVADLCSDWKLPLLVEKQKPTYKPGESRENYWRNGRYGFFHSLDAEVCVGTTLDDAVEWYLFSCLRGQGHYMKYQNKNVVKPLLVLKKRELLDYAAEHKLVWLEDPSNADVNFARRNCIRNRLLPEVVNIEPGIYNIVKQKIKDATHDRNIS